MSGNSYTYWDQGAHVSRETATAGAIKGRDGNAYGCNEEQRATMAELGLTLETAPRARGGKNEWEDALIKHKVMDAPLDHAKMRFMLDQKRQDDAFLEEKAAENGGKYRDADLDELEEAFEEDDDLDTAMFEKFRAARLAEMKEQAKKNKFGGLVHVTAQDYVKEVTQAPEDTMVFVHLYQDYIPECKRLNEVMEELSNRHKAVKFCKIKATDANAEYPDKALPTMVVYKGSDVLDRIVSLKTNGGHPITADGLEWRFAQQGFLKTELEEDPFADLSLSKMRVLHGAKGTRGRVGYGDYDSDSDSD